MKSLGTKESLMFGKLLESKALQINKGLKVAIDSYMFLYQFLVAIRSDGGQAFTNESGEETMHLSGVFYRTIKIMEHGIKPVYVFDGKAPEMKSNELEKRTTNRDLATAKLEEAKESGNLEDMEKFTKRTIKVTTKHTDEVKKMLELMGVPFYEAPSEAESQCAYFQKQGFVNGVATEDMDALTFGSGKMLRNFNARESKKLPIVEISLEKVLSEMDISMDMFIDLCILLGCDYCDTIGGIGPKRAYDLIKKHNSIEEILENIDREKYKVPKDWNYKGARKLFQDPEINKDEPKFAWKDPNEEELVQFLSRERGMNEERVRSGCAKLAKALKKPTQVRIDTFFKSKAVNSIKSKNQNIAQKTSQKQNKIKTK